MIKIKVINVFDDGTYDCKMFIPGYYRMFNNGKQMGLYVYEKGKGHAPNDEGELVITGDVYPEGLKAVDDILEGKNSTVITYKGQCTVYEGIYGSTSDLIKFYTNAIDNPPKPEEPVPEQAPEEVKADTDGEPTTESAVEAEIVESHEESKDDGEVK